MQALTAELFGFAQKIPLLFAEENLKTVCFHPIFQNRLINRRAASIDKLSSPQYVRRCEFRVIFAG
jgi:hypothetical protein